ncbi:hypothetical protein GH714_001542 [Hevea brasiliensis]|uniref:GOLD domain-containing protein n=1 Tax=Hevea brasiliensis TaxID=3981 RepID=A0A6A6MBE7_HEVBR|nr:hypothetical protein GH714_001542 [Hevea brasiliensis]
MEENTAQIPQEKEPSKCVSKKAMETENAKDEEKMSESKHEDEQKTKEIAVVEERREESDLLSDLKEHEKKALSELRSKIEEAILKNELFQEKKQQEKEISSTKDGEEKVQKEKSTGTDKKEDDSEKKEQPKQQEGVADQTVDKDISLWGVPLLPSKGDDRTDTVLLKLLRAREFKTTDAFEMLKNILKWRKENKIDSILEADIEANLGSMAYMQGNDRDGHPICFNIFAVFGNDELYGKAFEEKRVKFMRGRIQLMEKGIQKLDFKPGGGLQFCKLMISRTLLYQLRKSSGMQQREELNFFRTIILNLLQKMYIAASQIPVQYGGLKRENDSEFSVEDDAKEAIVKAGSQETIEIPAPEAGNTLIWDLTVSGWEVNYKEEFVPTDEGSYTIIVQKGRRITWQDGTVRNSFTNKEPGKVVITIENGAFKKKRILYRYKTRTSSSS